MKLGLIAGYSGKKIRSRSLIKQAEGLGYDSVWTAEAYGSDAVTPAAWMLARTDEDQGRHRDHADAGAHARDDRDDRDDARQLSKRPLHPRPRRRRARRSSKAGTACRTASR